MRNKIKVVIKTLIENIIIKRKLNLERKNIKEKERKKIYSKIKLTKKQVKSINKLYKDNYGKRVSLKWHKYYTAFTKNFDEYYFPELLYIPKLEHYLNLDKEYVKVFEDKNLLPFFAQKANVKFPKTIVSFTKDMFRDENYKVLNKSEAINKLYNIGKCFAKPTVDTSSGKGCMLLNIKNGFDEENNKNLEEIFEILGTDFVVQECIECHESIKKIYDKAVNTIRIITYRWNGEIMHTPSAMRMGRDGNRVDNGHAGGIFIAIEDDGKLHDTAFSGFKDEYKMHPDTKFVFANHKIQNFSKAIESAKRIHSIIPQIGIINWDFTIDVNGEPLLIEINTTNGSIWPIQMAHGKGAFGKLTTEILRWINVMDNLNVVQRKKHMFGKIKSNKKSDN